MIIWLPPPHLLPLPLDENKIMHARKLGYISHMMEVFLRNSLTSNTPQGTSEQLTSTLHCILKLSDVRSAPTAPALVM